MILVSFNLIYVLSFAILFEVSDHSVDNSFISSFIYLLDVKTDIPESYPHDGSILHYYTDFLSSYHAIDVPKFSCVAIQNHMYYMIRYIEYRHTM